LPLPSQRSGNSKATVKVHIILLVLSAHYTPEEYGSTKKVTEIITVTNLTLCDYK